MLRPYVVPALLTASPVRSSRELTSKHRPWFFASIHCSPFFCPLPYLCKPSPTPPHAAKTGVWGAFLEAPAPTWRGPALFPLSGPWKPAVHFPIR